MRHLNIKIFGEVQGVFFRYSAKEKAEELGIKGFARNERDGTVYIEAEGDEAAMEKFIDWSKKGPPSATVERVEATEGPMKNFKDFHASSPNS